MTDFENRVTEMFAERAANAPGAEGLATAAQSRQHRRRTSRAVLGAAAVVAAIVAVPVGLGALGVDEGDGPVATEPLPEPRSVPADWRWESYHDLEFAVPASWRYGSLSQHCISSNSNPVVERPDTLSTLVACPTPWGLGVLVSREGEAPTVTAADVPEGAAFGQATEAGVTLTVIAESQTLVDDVLGTARAYPGPDFSGCEAQVVVPSLGSMPAGASDASGPITVCRYEVGIEGPNLVASETLQGDQADMARLGIESLEPGEGPNPEPDTCLPSDETQAVLLRASGADLAWVHYDGCTTHGVDVGGTVSQLNAQVMWTAFGPNWSGGVGGEVPMPKEPRFVASNR
ncbi:MAG TPA: hypothetical protein VFK52_07095 [Nocardioidaceae bacterium]|nr:hypothetical protein [Nocardioidaceae bacterium]